MKTPTFLSRFCEKHKPRAFIPSDIHPDDGDQPGPSHVLSRDGGFPIVQLVTDKRSTRAAVYYQVWPNALPCLPINRILESIDISACKVTWLGQEDCHATWELASNLPPDVIAEYESGLQAEVTKESVSYEGQTSHTLTSTATQARSSQPPSKKAKASDKRPR